MNNIGVYILKGDRYYVGSTNNLVRRLEQHKNGQTHSTKRIGEWKLVKFIPCNSIEEARTLEREIKRSKHISRYV